MKAQFKYAFLTGLDVRGGVFAVILALNLGFIALSAGPGLPLAAQITAVSLGGLAIAVMLAVNLLSDLAIIRRLFFAPGAYLYALLPTPRWKILLASVTAMLALDLVTMTVVIAGEVWLSFLLAGSSISAVFLEIIHANAPGIWFGLWYIALFIAGYLLALMIILFCLSARQSLFFSKPAGWLLTLLLAVAVIYLVSVVPVILAPFGVIARFGIFFVVVLNKTGTILYVLLTFLEAAALFILTSKLMERRINI